MATKIESTEVTQQKKVFVKSEEVLDEMEANGQLEPFTDYYTDDDLDAPFMPVGSIFASAIPQSDARVHLLDGSSILQTGIYKTFVNLIKALVSAGNPISCSIAEYAVDMATTGNCGKFVINNTDADISNTSYNKKQDCIRHQGYRLNSTGALVSVSGYSVIFVPAKQYETLVITRTTTPPSNNYIYETTSASAENPLLISAPTFSTSQTYTITNKNCKFIGFTVADSEYDAMTITNTNGSVSVDANSIKLPTITTFIQGLSNIIDIGKSVEAGLPNIEGSLENHSTNSYLLSYGPNVTGAFKPNATGATMYFSNDKTEVSSNTGWVDKVKFDASLSNSIYGNSTTVQPSATMFPYYIVLASGYKSSQVVDVDNIMNEVNNKIPLKGSAERPTYNGKDLALYDDLTKMTGSVGFTDNQSFSPTSYNTKYALAFTGGSTEAKFTSTGKKLVVMGDLYTKTSSGTIWIHVSIDGVDSETKLFTNTSYMNVPFRTIFKPTAGEHTISIKISGTGTFSIPQWAYTNIYFFEI